MRFLADAIFRLFGITVFALITYIMYHHTCGDSNFQQCIVAGFF